MKSLHQYTALSGLIILFLLAGCAQANIQPTSQPQSQDTNTAVLTMTAIASPTQTPKKNINIIPAPTRRATFTLAANLTATVTPIPSFTRRPTKLATNSPTATSTQYVAKLRYGGIQFTSTPAPFKCTLRNVYPKEWQVFKPRTDFVARWTVINTGTNMWHKDDILFGFVGGQRMHNPEREANKVLDYTLYVKDHMDVTIHMRPPKEPGVYTTTWGLRKTNKTEFFCLLTTTIVVKK